MRRQSSRLRWPVRNLCASICATDATRRCSSDSFDISRLKNAIGWPPRMRDVFGEVERQRRFSLRRPRGENQKLRWLQSGSKLVELGVAGRNSGDALAFAKDFFEALEIVANDVLDRNEAGVYAVFGKREDGRFGIVENGVGAVFAFKGALLDVVRGVNQIAQNRFFFDDARVVLDVGDARHAVGERSEIGRAAGGFEFAVAVQLFGERDEVDGLLRFAERDHLHEDAAVLIEKEIFGAQIFDSGVERVVVEHDGAENGALGVEIVGKRAFESGFGGIADVLLSLSLRLH